ncbi:uncharacterized protein LOC132204477 [Neocloeon triangulifer]|uniref:uncharacterized protein LOC132204477 n=1 Tax=Neocloeon triangulifer TaxID=2078957 RepID=UPI00286F2BB1|nr:uncharacterized protein LOC132204477 [Neocloeon triangulifer]
MGRRFWLLMGLLFTVRAMSNDLPGKKKKSSEEQILGQLMSMWHLIETQASELKNLDDRVNVMNDTIILIPQQISALEEGVENTKQNEQHLSRTVDKLAKLGNEQQQQFNEIKEKMLCRLANLAKLSTLSNGKKYSFHTKHVKWTVANEICEKQGLHLATLKSPKDLQLVFTEAGKIKPGQSWWLSAKNHGKKGQSDFRWHDQSKLELNSSLWKVNADKEKDSVYIYYTGNLNSMQNLYEMYFICELPDKCY